MVETATGQLGVLKFFAVVAGGEVPGSKPTSTRLHAVAVNPSTSLSASRARRKGTYLSGVPEADRDRIASQAPDMLFRRAPAQSYSYGTSDWSALMHVTGEYMPVGLFLERLMQEEVWQPQLAKFVGPHLHLYHAASFAATMASCFVDLRPGTL